MNRPSSLSLIGRACELSFQNFWRNKLLSLATVIVIGIIIFIFNIILSINLLAQDAINELNRKVDLVVYLKDSTSYSQATEIISALSQIDGVQSVDYNSKEDALTEMQQSNPRLSTAFEKYGLGNPLPASLSIVTTNPEDHQKITAVLAKPQINLYLSNVISDTSGQEGAILNSVSQNLAQVDRFTNQVIFWLIVTFIGGGILIILNALHITIFTRRQEISVMKLVGAPYNFIRLPFIIEGIIYAVSSTLIGFIILLTLSGKIGLAVPHFLQFFIIELLATIAISIISSFAAVHHYLSQKEI